MAVVDPDSLVDARPTVQAALELGTSALQAAGIDGGRVDAEWLLAEALGIARGRLGLEAHRALEPPIAARYARALRRRLAREPLQHIVGTQPFRDVTVKVSGDALVPRPETELLAGWALELLAPRPRPRVIDVGTGTGCIACALAFERTDLTVLALDISPPAVALARDNVAALGLVGRVRVEVSDLFGALAGVDTERGGVRADLVVSNPPYLPTALIATLAPEVSRYDPRPALDGGLDGLDVLRRLVDEAPRWLAADGTLMVETAGGAQAHAVAALMTARGFARIETRPDLAGVERFVAGGMP
jgi:release factor glutamine methyltransferase